MSIRITKCSIDVTKIDKTALHDGKKGKYLDLRFIENRDGASQYGDTHFIVQGLPKERREAGEKGPIIGNATFEEVDSQPRQQSQPNRKPAPPVEDDDSSDIPF